MPTSALRDIRAFPELVRYLEDELDWPLQQYGFDELTFEYSPAELGLKEEFVPHIKNIHQMRPLVRGQPWGIFFVEFENKKLPVAVLRSILSHLVIKKRDSANKASAPAWHAEDLLFITAFGEENTDTREIAFAHFHQHPNDKPTLNVLSWDGGNTPLTLARIDHILRERLHWPEDESNATAWRESWRQPFKYKVGHIIRTADLLAEELAKLARGIREKAKAKLAVESEKGPLTKLYKAFQTALIHDLTPDSFADTYAQTITYGLLTAAISRTEIREGRQGIFVRADDIADIVPVTNPFLKEMLQTFLKAGGRKGGMDFDELGIQDVVELLRGEETDLPAVIADFGNKNPNEDPVIHFYEHFLAAYDKPQKKQRGVFYTPQPVVSYIVRSVNELLQTEFGLKDGLASTITWGEMAKQNPGIKIPEGTSPDSPFVTILDPATGTATFLVEVISVIHRTLSEKWKNQGMNDEQRLEAWNDYVPKHLLPRLFGYELMMAPYAIAHMKIGLKLHETGYRFGSEERVRVYLTNALEPATDVKGTNIDLEVLAPALAHEGQAVNAVKRKQRFTVVVGNPPYAQYSMNLNDAAKAHIEKFRYANGQKIRARNALQLERNLNDDYVKFIGFGAELLPYGTGVFGMITNRMFLDSESLVGFREWLATNFTRLYFVDLWGSSEESRRVKRLATDENVFDILQGVAISFVVRRQERKTAASPTKSREVIGTRDEKYRLLSADFELRSADWVETQPEPASWLLHRDSSDRGDTEHEFTLAEIFPQFSTLVASNRDHLVVDFERDVVIRNVEEIRSFRGSNKDWSEKFGITLKTGWNVNAAREKLAAIRDISAFVRPIEYRSFDRRWIFFHSTLVWQTAPISSNNVLKSPNNRILISLGKNRAETTNGHWVSTTLADKSVVSSRDNASGFPLYLFDEDGELDFGGSTGRPNISSEFLRHLGVRLALPQEGQFSLPRGLTPEDIFHYIYAVFHSPSYRSRYAEFLKIDFPRIPLTGSLELFRSLAQLGGELVALHLLESPKVNDFITRFEGKGDNSIPKKPIYKDCAVWINSSQRFEGVPEAVWNFHIGGYQVCEKWLKDRKGRTLSLEDITHYQRVVVALNETIRLMAEIDRVIEAHGGWPGAFHSGEPESQPS